MPSSSARSAAVAGALALVLSGLAAVLVAAPPAAAYPTATVRFDGHGWGHGRGLGQYGSLGYAIDERQTYSSILDHYYSNTTKATQADGLVTVHLLEFDNVDLIVTSGSPFTMKGTPDDAAPVSFAAGEAALLHRADTGFELHKASSCAGPWGAPVKTYGATTQPEATTTYAGDDVKSMLRTCGPTGNVRSYRGNIKMAASTTLMGTTTYAINTLPMEQYLRGVVPRESPASWGDLGSGAGLNALRAQAVAARSYAWAENRNPGLYKTCDTTACQVYGGAGLNGTRIEDSRSDKAISDTAGEVRMLNGAIARTEFSSSTGGWTAGGTFPAVEDTGDDVSANPFHNWTVEIKVSDVEAAFPDVGTLQAISVTKRNELGADGGRVLNVKVVGSDGTASVTGNDVRSKLGLRSDWFSVVDVPVDVTRLAGSDRIATSIAISKDGFQTATANAAVLASSANYPDALVGTPLAVKANGPILLTDPAGLSAGTKAELERVLPKGAQVYLLGGTSALSQAVEDQVKADGYDVVRLGGANRFDTAVKVAGALGNPTTVLEATGLLFPDALAAGAAAAEVRGAILLTNGAAQSPETAAYLQAHPPTTKYAIGGSAASADPAATKVAGTDRYATAVAVATQFFDGAAAGGLASGEAYPDALGGGVHAALRDGPLLLTQAKTLPPTTGQFFRDRAGVLTKVFAYGGTSAISDAVITDLRTS